MPNSTAGRIGGNFLTLSAGQLAGRIIAALTTIYLARVLLEEGFGAIAFATSLLSFAILIVDFGLDMLGPREVARGQIPLRKLAGAIVTWRLMLTVPAFAALALFVWLADLSPATRVVILLYGLSLVTYALDLTWLLLGAEKMRPVAIAETLSLALVALGVWLFVAEPANLFLVPLLFLAGRLLSVALLWLIVWRHLVRFRLGWNRALLTELWPAMKPLAGTRIVSTTLAHFDLVLIGLLLTEEAAGQYGVAYRLYWMPVMLVQTYYLALRPAVARTYLTGLAPFMGQLRNSSRLLMALVIGMTAGSILLAQPLIFFLFTDVYTPAVLPFQLLMVSFFLHAAMGHYRQLLISFEHQAVVFRIMAVGAFFNVVANLVLLSIWGIVGAAAATLLSSFLILCLSYLLTWRHIRRIPLGRFLIKPGFAALCMALALFWTAGWPLLSQIVLGGAIYLAVLFMLRVVKPAEVRHAVGLLRPQRRSAPNQNEEQRR